MTDNKIGIVVIVLVDWHIKAADIKSLINKDM